MSILKAIASIFTGGATKSIETIASEWIETDLEKAEAKTLMIKTLDPNGLMRREISRRVTFLYTCYVFIALILLALESFGMGDIETISIATSKVTELFTPITTLFGTIVSVSFGVNYSNVRAESKISDNKKPS